MTTYLNRNSARDGFCTIRRAGFNPKPYGRPGQGDQATEIQSPGPAYAGSNKSGEYGSETAADIAAGIQDAGGRAYFGSGNMDRRRPKRDIATGGTAERK